MSYKISMRKNSIQKIENKNKKRPFKRVFLNKMKNSLRDEYYASAHYSYIHHHEKIILFHFIFTLNNLNFIYNTLTYN